MWRRLFVAAATTIASMGAGAAQEIVVTASRYQSFQELLVPHIYLKRRADFVIVALQVRSDTRDFSQRQNEMREALRALQARARDGQVTLALVNDSTGLVREFSMAAAEELVRADRRPDTSVLTIRLRTPAAAADTLETIQARIDRFVAQTPKPGRIEMETGASELTLINPEQYRAAMLAEIAADGRTIAALLGASYGVEVGGLERQVAWQRSGDLELTLFVPYGLAVRPQP